MAMVITDDRHYQDIAAAIRAKSGSGDTYKPSQMAAAIAAIDLGAKTVSAVVSSSTSAFTISNVKAQMDPLGTFGTFYAVDGKVTVTGLTPGPWRLSASGTMNGSSYTASKTVNIAFGQTSNVSVSVP